MKEKRGGEKKQKQKYKGVTIFFTLYTIEEQNKKYRNTLTCKIKEKKKEKINKKHYGAIIKLQCHHEEKKKTVFKFRMIQLLGLPTSETNP